MANEIKVTLSSVYSNGQLSRNFQPGQIGLPQANQGLSEQTVTVNTSAEEDLPTTALGTPGLVILHNLEATTSGNYVEWGPKGSTGSMIKMGKLAATELAVLRYASSTCVFRWQADTAAVNVQVLHYEA